MITFSNTAWPASSAVPRSGGRIGFSIMEVLVAASVLVLGIMSTLSMQRFLTDLQRNCQSMNAAYELAQAKIAQLNAVGFATATSGNDATNIYCRAWTVAAVGGTSHKTASVTVAWTNFNGRLKSVQAYDVILR